MNNLPDQPWDEWKLQLAIPKPDGDLTMILLRCPKCQCLIMKEHQEQHRGTHGTGLRWEH